MPPRAVQKVMVQPINLIFRFLQNVSFIYLEHIQRSAPTARPLFSTRHVKL